MDQTHITEEDLREALDGYRWALTDALSEAGAGASREEIIALARTMLAEDEPDQHELIVELAAGDSGDPVWNLEEEIVDDDESVPDGDPEEAEDSDDEE